MAASGSEILFSRKKIERHGVHFNLISRLFKKLFKDVFLILKSIRKRFLYTNQKHPLGWCAEFPYRFRKFLQNLNTNQFTFAFSARVAYLLFNSKRDPIMLSQTRIWLGNTELMLWMPLINSKEC